MTTTSTKPKRPPKPPAKPSANNEPSRQRPAFEIVQGVQSRGEKAVIYGPGGVGKTELASLLEDIDGPVLFLDLEDGTDHLDVSRVRVREWAALLDIVDDAAALSEYGAVVVDSLTKAEEFATAWVVENVPHETGGQVASIEGYGFGKGYVHIYGEFVALLSRLDAIARGGVHVVLICHECVANVPNPTGADWIRFEPRLQSPASGKSSVRHRVKEWADHVLFVAFDTNVSKDGKASGSGSRTIYPQERPGHLAKSRRLDAPLPYRRGDGVLWHEMLEGGDQ